MLITWRQRVVAAVTLDVLMFRLRIVCASCRVDTKPHHQSHHMATSEAGRRSERLALTQNKQSRHVPTIKLATKDDSPEVTRDAALLQTEQAEFTGKIKMKAFPLSAGIQRRLTTRHQSDAKWS